MIILEKTQKEDGTWNPARRIIVGGIDHLANELPTEYMDELLEYLGKWIEQDINGQPILRRIMA